ncbi:WS/DGAT domain-containing protein, partial [Gordonia sp. (in: high G+C Gram-positive bacteria)]|uniref:WS/DGAT domain-containing protein n=1 Tax=Gordonia sp. (in: high G+C Gram-positive bacteria) TaxID=84139 RepID=UPI0016A5B074
SLLKVPLADVKRTAREAQTTVNVVFLGAVAEAVGRYHRANGYDLPSMRVNMPISIRTPEDAATGNHWVPARFVVPTQEIPLEHRLYQLDGLVHTARKDPALKFADGVYKALALLPDPVTSRIAGALMKGVDVAATNVPGPPVPVYLCGARVRAIIPFAPKSGAALNISFMSYDEDAFIGINADPAAVEDPAELVRHLADAFDELTQARLTPGAE